MASTVPSVIYYKQAIVLLKDLATRYNAGLITTSEDFLSQYRDIVAKYMNSAGSTVYRYNPIAFSEPPDSAKFNRAWSDMNVDIQVTSEQMDFNRAAGVFLFNLIVNDLMQAQNENAALKNKIKTLKLYTDFVNKNVFTFSDFLISQDFLDDSKTSTTLVPPGILTLKGVSSKIENHSNIKVKIIPSYSNGVWGNSQEIQKDATNYGVVSIGDAIEDWAFVSDTHNAYKKTSLVDGTPDTVFEYEIYKVDEQNRRQANFLGFTYDVAGKEVAIDGFDWSVGPAGGVLRLGLEFEFPKMTPINHVSIDMYPLLNSANNPVLLKKLDISKDGVNWETVSPTDIWVATNSSLSTVRVAENQVGKQFAWVFEKRDVKFARLYFEQPNSITVDIGHWYYVDTETSNRVEGPVPQLNEQGLKILETNDPKIVKKLEHFVAKRWAIGIRDISFESVIYEQESQAVTKPILTGGVVSRVSISSESSVPSNFDSRYHWIKYYISPDMGLTWHQISRIQDGFFDLPEIIAYNDPIPVEFRESGVTYYKTTSPINSLLLKIVISRPAAQTYQYDSPYVKSYKVKVVTQ